MSDHVGRIISVEYEPKKTFGAIVQELAQIYRLRSELKRCRNELCQKCGQYKEAHNGACDGCRYRHGGEWEVDLNG